MSLLMWIVVIIVTFVIGIALFVGGIFYCISKITEPFDIDYGPFSFECVLCNTRHENYNGLLDCCSEVKL